MHNNVQFLSTELQASIAELRTLDDPDARARALDLLTDRILKDSEAQTTSLQLTIERIEKAFDHRHGLLERKLIADNQTRTSDIYQMVSQVRNAQIEAHPQITQALAGVNAIQKTNEDIEIWVSRLEAAFVQGRDYAASERSKLWQAVDLLDERLTTVEQARGIVPAADPPAEP